MAAQAQQAAERNDMKTLYNITKQLGGRKANTNRPVKGKNGNILSKPIEQLERWKEHFSELLTCKPANAPFIEEGEDLDVHLGPISKAEIIQAISKIKTGKAPGPDNILPEVLKAEATVAAKILMDLFQEVWEKEEVPKDWKKGYIIKLSKKGDLSKCKNWRAIQLLSLPSKIFTRIILERIRAAVDKKLRDEQAGFRTGRSCVDQIATLRIIIEPSMEWQSPLFINFIDFKQAFESVDSGDMENTEKLWNSAKDGEGYTEPVRGHSVPRYTQHKRVGALHSEHRSPSGMFVVATDLLPCDRLGDENGNEPSTRNSVDAHEKVRRP